MFPFPLRRSGVRAALRIGSSASHVRPGGSDATILTELSMEPSRSHPHVPDTSFDGGDLDCGNGLLLLISQHIDPLAARRLAGDPFHRDLGGRRPSRVVPYDQQRAVSWTKEGKQRSFIVCKGKLAERRKGTPVDSPTAVRQAPPIAVPAAAGAALRIPPLAVMGVGSWPRPRWMLEATHVRLEGLPEAEFKRPPTMPCGWRSMRSCARRGRRHRRRAAPRQLRQLRRRRPRQLPVDSPHRSAPATSMTRTSSARNCARSTFPRGGPPPGGLRPPSAQPAARPFASWSSCDSHRLARQGGATRAVPADPHDVDGVRGRSCLRPVRRSAEDLVKALREGLRGPARWRGGARAVRRARPDAKPSITGARARAASCAAH